ncbi:nucleotidyltransferase domain-containing protein [Pimelobacter simplex]|uniref:nucleotidyltransferase domain-containing protein n=1 Tax=Nocardioides simplex TaxID=2045 RepID=UPI003AADC955
MRDPGEGVSRGGLIVTGARRDRIPAAYRAVLDDAVALLGDGPGAPSLYVYGSVATGQAEPGRSDVDLLTVGLPRERAAALGAELSDRFAGLGRGVEVACLGAEDLADVDADAGVSDAAYGNRAFLRHYCVHLAGPDPAADLPPVPADRRAARGFNGDLAAHLAGWRTAPEGTELARRISRKTLLALAGLVSIRERTWTTDRATAAARWPLAEPDDAPAVRALVAAADPAALLAPDGPVEQVLRRFAAEIGLWAEPNPAPAHHT